MPDLLAALQDSVDRARADGSEVPDDVARRWLAERDEARAALARARDAGGAMAQAFGVLIQMDYGGNAAATAGSRFVQRAIADWKTQR